MDNLGYKNWKSGYNDDSYESSPSPQKYGDYYSGKSGGKGSNTGDSFDYDISSDFAESPPVDYSKRGSRGTAPAQPASRFSADRTRASVSDRAKEILERNKAVGKAVGDIGDGGRLQSYQDTFKDLMEGLEDRIPAKKAALETSNTKSNASLSHSKFESTLDSPRGDDSLEISAADLEVGALAARRAREKASDRRRRMSLDKAPHTLDQSSFQSMKETAMRTRKGSASPDFATMRKGAEGGPASMQFSSALSSIQRSIQGDDDKVGYGSMGRSDDDIYKMLNVTAGTNDSIKFGDSARQSAANSRTSNLRASSGGNRDDSRQAGKKPTLSRHTERDGGSDGGDVSDVTQGSSRDDDDSPDRREYNKKMSSVQGSTSAAPKKTIAAEPSTLVSARGSKPGSSYATMRELEDSDSDGNSGDSDKAHSPFSKSGSFSFPAAADSKGVVVEARTHEDDDEYSLDDFEPDAFTSPEKAPKAPPTGQAKAGDSKVARSVTSSATATPSTASSTPQTQGSGPPKKLGSPTPAHKTLTPTNSTSSMQSMPKSAGLNSVEEIMQRWYTADSEFMQRSLQRIGTGETGFSLDDAEDNGKADKSGKAGIASASPGANDSMVSTPIDALAPSNTGDAGIVASTVSENPTPSIRDATPSPLTTAAPTPVTLITAPTPVNGGGVGVAENVNFRPASANSQYSADSAGQDGGSTAGNSVAAVSNGQTNSAHGSLRASPLVGLNSASSVGGTELLNRAGVANLSDDRNIFDLSDSYNDAPHMPASSAPISSMQAMQAPVPTAASAHPVRNEPAPKPFEAPRLFANRESAYMALDQLPVFDDLPRVEGPAPQSNYHRNARSNSTGQGSLSPSLSAASRYRDSDDAQDQPSEDSISTRSARDPLTYVLGESAIAAPTNSARADKKSWIVPPKARSRRSHSAPPGASDRPSTAPSRGREEDYDTQPPRRMSAATAAKIQQLKSLSPEERSRHRSVRARHGVSASTAAPNAITSIRWQQRERELQAVAGERKSTEAVQRLTQENWRLFRKYERLEHELADIRMSQQSLLNDSANDVPPPPKPFLYKRSPGIGIAPSSHNQGNKEAKAEKPPKPPRTSVFDVSGFTTRDTDHVKPPSSASTSAKHQDAAAKNAKTGKRQPAQDAHDEGSGNELQSPSAADRPSGIPRLEKDRKSSAGSASAGTGGDYAAGRAPPTVGWEVHMEEALQRLKEENRKLLEREKDVLVREQALAIREATVEMKEKMVGELASKKSKEDQKKDFFVNEELTILREREQDLMREVDKLKAALFVQGQDAAAVEDGKLRISMGLDTELDIDGSYKPLAKAFSAQMHKAGVYPQNVLKPALKSHYLDKVKGKDDAAGADGETVSVNKAEYEKLINDHAAQERLLDSFQKENDRLAKFAREKETEQQLRSAVFFDQREELNKEVNRLKNVTRASGTSHPTTTVPVQNMNFDDVPVPTSRKTAETLRMELQMDATIRALKEQLADAESGRSERERDLQVTIEKLRRDNRELAAKAANVTLQQITPQDSDFLQLQTENRVFAEKVATQQHRLEWYAQNQKLLDIADDEVQQSRQAVATLKRELVQRGLEAKAVDRLIGSSPQGPTKMAANSPDQDEAVAAGNNSGAEDRSLMSGAGGKGRVQSSGRSFADIKKIKELEGVIRDLQDSLTKRHPDSVANLIRAAKDSDSVQLERRRLEQHIASLEQEVEDIKQKHEKKMRSVRQEHERMNIKYENLLSEFKQVKVTDADVSGQGLGGYGKGSDSAVNSVKTLSQALNKIRELEVEAERTRAFYQKKVEDGQRKFDAQLRALKRGEHTDNLDRATPAANQFGAPSSPQQQDVVNQQVQQATRMYTERLALLEKELMVTAQELGRVKAANLAREREQQPSYSGYPAYPQPFGAPFTAPYTAPQPPPAPPAQPTQPVARTRSDSAGTPTHHDSKKMSSSERQELQTKHEQRLEELTAAHNAHLAQLNTQWSIERDGLQKRLREEEARCAELRRELMNAVRGAAQSVGVPGVAGTTSRVTVVESKAPELKQFLQMESQIDALEVRLQRREKELLAAVDEAKAAATLERSRLEALHAQECREKDEQLVRFQQELVQLVTALRHWKQNAEMPGFDTKSTFPLFV